MNEPLTRLPGAAPADHAGKLSSALRTATSVRTRPERPSGFSNALIFGWRALLKIKHVPEQSFDVIITPIMFTVMFTYLFGGAIAGSTQAYLQFLLPGILAQTVVFTCLYTGVTLNTDMGKGIYDRFKSMPIWAPSPIVGAMLGDVLRYTTSSSIVLAVGMLMGYRPETGVLGVLAAFILLNLFAFGASWIFTILGLILRTPGAVMTVSWIFLMPITFASNIYVDPATMPDWLRTFVNANPVTHLVTAIRGFVDGGVTLGDIGRALLAPAILTVTCAPLAMMLYRRKR
jgi:ABC-2 type transport system permease protein